MTADLNKSDGRRAIENGNSPFMDLEESGAEKEMVINKTEFVDVAIRSAISAVVTGIVTKKVLEGE